VSFSTNSRPALLATMGRISRFRLAGLLPCVTLFGGRLLIARRGHGSIILVYPEDGPKVLAGIRRFIADQSQP